MRQGLRQQEFTAREVRELIRNNEYGGATSGLASGFVQANLVILPGEYAFDFLKFCVRNPKPCPILEVTEAGDPEPVVTAQDADLRTDVPNYRVYENGELVEEPQNIEHLWQGRPGRVPYRVQLYVRGGAAGCGLAGGARGPGPKRPHVRHRQGLCTLRSLCRTYGGKHAPLPRR